MIQSNWPKPPVHSDNNLPEIPERYKSFGVEYKVVDGFPVLDIPSKPLNLQNIKESISRSYSLFLKTLRTLDGNLLNEISDIHVHINEEINMAKVLQKEELFILAKNKKTRIKNKVLEDLDKIVNQ